MTYVNAASCECPRCRREFMVHWCWERENLIHMRWEDGEAVTAVPGINVTRVAYERRVTCPTCGVQLLISHELVPKFYATARDTTEGGD